MATCEGEPTTSSTHPDNNNMAEMSTSSSSKVQVKQHHNGTTCNEAARYTNNQQVDEDDSSNDNTASCKQDNNTHQRLVEYFFILTSLPSSSSSTTTTNQQQSLDLSSLQEEEESSTKSKTLERSTSTDSTDTHDTLLQSTDTNANAPLDSIITARYPLEDHPDNPLSDMVTCFCHPVAGKVQLLTEFRLPHVHYFVSTGDRGQKMYGVCLTVYEPFEEFEVRKKAKAKELQQKRNKTNKSRSRKHHHRTRSAVLSAADCSIEVGIEEPTQMFVPKCLVILSKWPYWSKFREYLTQLYRLSTTPVPMDIPIERYIMNICSEVPSPPPTGVLEVQVSILDSNIRFWTPPANQPIAWISLPFSHLFSCLDISNIILVWHALTMERQILLTSSQLTLLGTCAEIFLSMLFPLSWTHMYVPVLPHFLTPVLDAPMPYLCGISKSTLHEARGDLSPECIVVDLDENTVTMGVNTPPLPPLPSKRRQKLEKALELNAGGIFKAARCSVNSWRDRLKNLDSAFAIAFTPDSESSDLNEAGISFESSFSSLQSIWDAVQEAFLRFFVSVLKHYRKYLVYPSGVTAATATKAGFRSKHFIAKQQNDFQPYLQTFCGTQLFDAFITKRLYDPGAADVIFFDQSIDAKLNRSKLKIKKMETPYLQSASLHLELNTIVAEEPYRDENSTVKYAYSSLPDVLDPELFGTPRPLSPKVTEELNKTHEVSLNSAIRLRNKATHVAEDIFQNADVASFHVFFMTFTAIVGRELQSLRRSVPAADPFSILEEENYGRMSAAAGAYFDVQQAPELQSFEVEYHPPVSPSESAPEHNDQPQSHQYSGALTTPPLSAMIGSSSTSRPPRPRIHRTSPSMVQRQRFRASASASLIEEARSVAVAQLSLAFEALHMMRKRKMVPDSASYQSLIDACGRCGDANRATQLMGLMHEDGLVADSVMYSCLLNAFSVDNDVVGMGLSSRNISSSAPPSLEPVWTNGKTAANKSIDWNTLRKKSMTQSMQQPQLRMTYSNIADVLNASNPKHHHNSDTSDSMSVNTTLSVSTNTGFSLSEYFRNPSPRARAKNKLKSEAKSLLVTDAILRQLQLGELYLEDLYPNLSINVHGEICPACSKSMSVHDIKDGWTPGDSQDYTTKCPRCARRFVPRFSVKSSSIKFVGSRGPLSELYCEFLSPWVLKKEIKIVMSKKNGIDVILRPEWRQGDGHNATLWWNLIVSFLLSRLPITFLLQGSVRTRLITPMPDS